MSSSVFFKFKSQKEPTRVEFDGTGISVFELKREIITKSGLGDGTDFDLFIYTEDNSGEYDDDTTIIPRSTTVVARRQPALKPGAGRAARYVSGKMPIAAKNASRREQSSKASASKPSTTAISQMHNAMTEEEKMAAMFAAQTEQWSAQQEEMSHQAPIYNKGGPKKPLNVPDHDPPEGYICYRCGTKGHWIQVCPTNDDPEFDNRPRVKKTTGIPRSFLQKIDKSVVMAQSEGDDTKRPSGVMVNADGDFVIAEPDKASWEQFQAKTKTAAAEGNETSDSRDKEAEELGLECPLDKKILIEPMKTPCCQKTFCNDCITNALIESDFICPACQSEGVLIDDLQPDEVKAKTIREYLKQKETEKAASATAEATKSPLSADAVSSPKDADSKEASSSTANGAKHAGSPKESDGVTKSSKLLTPISTTSQGSAQNVKSPQAGKSGVLSPAASTTTATEDANQNISKKRSADDALENPKIPKGPKAMANQSQQQPQQQQQQMEQQNMADMMNGMGMNNMMFNGMGMMPNMMGMPGMPGMNMGMPGGMNPMGMPMMNDMNNMGMNMGMGMGMGMNMNMNMMGMQGFPGPNGWDMNGNMQQQGGFPNQNGNPHYYPGNNNYNNNHHNHGQWNNGNTNFNNNGNSGGGGDEGAYFRNPVNPHRHQHKQKRIRPSDYREL